MLRTRSYYESLCAQLPPAPASPLGPKPADLERRRKEASRLSTLMTRRRPFCFLRLGDMDLSYLLAVQEGRLDGPLFGEDFTNGTLPAGNPGLGLRYGTRFQKAFEGADYVDFYERLWPVEHWLPRLRLNRSRHSQRNPDRETSFLPLTWLEYEFKDYCQYRRVGIAGAEARLLELLVGQPAWRESAAPWWPEHSEVYFHQVREDGRNLDRNLDIIQDDLREFVLQSQIDTLFLSLGGGAKILCYELSRELNICAFDFGAMLRALTYSACDGNRAARATHSPFLFRVPFDVYMTVLEEAFPDLTPEELLAKAHAQLLLEVLEKEVGWTHTSWEYDFSPRNIECFRRAHRLYRGKFKSLFRASPMARRERSRFLHFCGKHGLTWEGRAFYVTFLAKATLASVYNQLRHRDAVRGR